MSAHKKDVIEKILFILKAAPFGCAEVGSFEFTFTAVIYLALKDTCRACEVSLKLRLCGNKSMPDVWSVVLCHVCIYRVAIPVNVCILIEMAIVPVLVS